MNTVANQVGVPPALPPACIPWMRSNHAGETGAVWIYRGAALAFWSSRIRLMAREHGATEQRHLQLIEAHLPQKSHSRLLPLWRLLGFALGFLPALFGYRIFCLTIYAVETFVEQHYLQQIEWLQARHPEHPLLDLLQACCAEEVLHQQDALRRMGEANQGFLASTWMRIVGVGSDLAVRASLRI